MNELVSDPGAPDPQPSIRVLRPSRGRFVALGAMFAALSLFGVALAAGGLWYGWPCAALFGIAAAACFLQLSSRFAGLTLYPDRFEVQAGFRREVHRWEDVAGFAVGRVDRTPAVVFNRAEGTASGAAAGSARRLIRAARGYDHWLPGGYGMTVEDLARLMNDWRRRATGGQA